MEQAGKSVSGRRDREQGGSYTVQGTVEERAELVVG
jgi:hypothetical protein